MMDILDHAASVVGTDVITSPAAPALPLRLDEDGKWGRATNTAIQLTVGTPVDGEVWRQSASQEARNPGLTSGWKFDGKTGDGGSPMVHGIHRELLAAGIPKSVLGDDDGKAGPKHFTGLQMYLADIDHYDGRIDGRLDNPSITVEGLQRAYNNGVLFK